MLLALSATVSELCFFRPTLISLSTAKSVVEKQDTQRQRIRRQSLTQNTNPYTLHGCK